jgi:predicted membrane metal-binding protein
VRLRTFLRRNEAETGRALSVHHNRYGIGTVLGAFVLWLVCSALFLLNPEMGVLATLLAAVLLGAVAIAALVLLSGEILVVCERALVLGNANLWRTPFVIRYDQITVGSMVPVHRSRLYARTTGQHGRTSTIRNPAWVNQGIHLVGPAPAEALRSGRALGAMTTGSGRSIDHRWIWFAGTGSAPPEQVTAQIAQAAGACGLDRFARATATAPPRELTGRRADAPRLLPGFPR